MEKNKQNWVLGICPSCKEEILSTQKYKEIEIPSNQWSKNNKPTKIIVHNKIDCVSKIYESHIFDLKDRLKSAESAIDFCINPKEEVKHIKNGNNRID